MAESSERALTPDEASGGGAVARDPGRFAASCPAIIPFEDT
jgi:hypothetical protein